MIRNKKCNCSEPTSKMLRTLEVWRIRQIKLHEKALIHASMIRAFSAILLGSEQLQI